MMKYLFVLILAMVIVGCDSNHVAMLNKNEGKLTNHIKMEEVDVKTFHLDSCSAPRPTYMHLTENDSTRELSFLNEYNGSIYKYDYDSGEYLDLLELPIGSNKIINPRGYVFVSDTICGILDTSQMKLFMYDIHHNNILSEYDLKGDKKSTWPKFFPQYYPTTANPLNYLNGKIYLSGQSFFSLNEDKIQKFKFETVIDIDDHSVRYETEYPDTIYGDDANWEGGLQTSAYIAYRPDGSKIYSFPPSHEVLVRNGTSHEWKYGGSNYAKTICSIDKAIKKTNNKDMVSNYIGQDMYGAILYDKYRDLIYRYITYGLPSSEIKDNPLDKKIGIIVMDKDLNYLGEVTLGSGHNWNVNNSFITREGLNIEYISGPDDENSLIIKTINFK